MHENNYLTTNLKKYYLDDFNKLLSLPSDDYYSIGEKLKDILIQINKIENYSKPIFRKTK